MSQGCRLPDTVVPLKYSICYDDLDLDRCIFLGRVTISCKVGCSVQPSHQRFASLVLTERITKWCNYEPVWLLFNVELTWERM